MKRRRRSVNPDAALDGGKEGLLQLERDRLAAWVADHDAALGLSDGTLTLASSQFSVACLPLESPVP